MQLSRARHNTGTADRFNSIYNMQKINTHRVYSDPDGSTAEDGYRIFVDRLWPRGESKESFHYDLWAKDVAPSAALREWFHADPDNRWEEFARRYTDELRSNPAAIQLRRDIAGRPLVTLLYGSKDTIHNNATVLADFLRQ